MNLRINSLNKIMALFIVSPSVGVTFGIIRFNSTLMLMLMLMLIFMSKLASNDEYFNKKILFHWLIYVVIVLFVIIVQSEMLDTIVVDAHLKGMEGRFVGTFGSFNTEKTSFLRDSTIRHFTFNLLMLLLAFFLSYQKQHRVKEFLFYLIMGNVIFQLLWFVLILTGTESQFTSIFMSSKIINGEIHTGITKRFGLIRVSGGFSEPSFMATLVWIVVSSIIYFDWKVCQYSKREVFVILSCLIFLFGTTISSFMMYNILIYMFYFFFLRNGKAIGAINISIVIVLQMLSILVSSDLFAGGLESVIERQFRSTEIYLLSFQNFVFGVSFGDVFNFPFIDNFIVQTGLLGLLAIIILYFATRSFLYFFSSMLIVISVAPNFSYIWFYLATSFYLGLSNHNR